MVVIIIIIISDVTVIIPLPEFPEGPFPTAQKGIVL